MKIGLRLSISGLVGLLLVFFNSFEMYSTIVVMYYGESPKPNWITKVEAAGAGVLKVKISKSMLYRCFEAQNKVIVV